MRLIKASAYNFGSYKKLEFTFDDKGLCLINGPTGAGKSTLQDVAAWGLYGITAKNGGVDDVRNWDSEGSITHVEVEVQVGNETLTVVRKRGTHKQNDLYWMQGDSGTAIRGKDITDTQRLLETRLGVSKDLFILGSYYNEFSPSGLFFMNKNSVRREMFETIASLDLPVKLAELASGSKKDLKKQIFNVDSEIMKLEAVAERLQKDRQNVHKLREDWTRQHVAKLDRLIKEKETFEAKKFETIRGLREKLRGWDEMTQKRISHLHLEITSYEENLRLIETQVCETCGARAPDQKQRSLLTQAQAELSGVQWAQNPYLPTLERAIESKSEHQQLIDELKKQQNPYSLQLDNVDADIEANHFVREQCKVDKESLDYHHFIMESLYELSFDLRSEILRNTVSTIQNETNRILQTYFDSVFKITLLMPDADKIDCEITKDGNLCSYNQLSKGQRGLVKLAFSVSVMKAVSDRAGVQFNCLFFDEALDGMDTELKLKAFGLFQELAKGRDAILTVDHSEALKSLFDNTVEIELIAGESVVK